MEDKRVTWQEDLGVDQEEGARLLGDANKKQRALLAEFLEGNMREGQLVYKAMETHQDLPAPIYAWMLYKLGCLIGRVLPM